MDNFEQAVQMIHERSLVNKQEYDRLKEKGCNFCKGDKPSKHISEFDFCPICGRKLKP